MLNNCQFIGNLGADPEIRTFNNGDQVANIRLAVSERWKDKNTGEKKEKTEWINVSVFGALVSVVRDYIKKGSKIYISGKMQTRKYQNQNGEDKYSTEIILQGFDAKLIMLDSRGGGDGDHRRNDGAQGQQKQQSSNQSQGSYGQQSGGFSNDLDDADIPF